jgi:hypothetical protein
MDKPDHLVELNMKSGRKRAMEIFADQPLKGIGQVSGEFTSSSYICRVESRAGLVMPDLEAVSIFGYGKMDEAASELVRFYKGAGWAVKALEPVGSIKRRHVAKTAWHGRTFIIIEHDYLECLATTLGYSKNTLGFYRENSTQ